MPPAQSQSPTPAPLLENLKARIRDKGPITIADYMAVCLGDPEHGYYATRDPLGAAGDFTTAPEISQIFGELIGLWCVVVWQQMGEPSPFKLIELGPGRGTLMADALRAASHASAFCTAAEIHLVETSRALRTIQNDTLASHGGKIHWHEALDDVPHGASIVVGNEFLDALPVRQFQMAGGQWFERCVGLSGNDELEFCLTTKPAKDGEQIPAEIRETAKEGDMAEMRPALDEIVKILATRADKAATVALFIDYGHETSAPGETLQAVRNHEYANPLAAPGEADLTAHVDFGALGKAGRDASLNVHDPMTQGAFLISLGLRERCERLLETASDDAARDILSGAQRLADTAQMGDLFKVMALSSHGLALPPFDIS